VVHEFVALVRRAACVSAESLTNNHICSVLQSSVRSFLADYGVPLMVLIWTGVSYALQSATPQGIPRRLAIPDPWEHIGKRNFNVLTQLGDVGGAQIAYAIVPALIISLLFYFDHNVSSQLAQQADFGLVRPPAYHWDLGVLGVLTVRMRTLGARCAAAADVGVLYVPLGHECAGHSDGAWCTLHQFVACRCDATGFGVACVPCAVSARTLFAAV
jgi:HCO3- transporter family